MAQESAVLGLQTERKILGAFGGFALLRPGSAGGLQPPILPAVLFSFLWPRHYKIASDGPVTFRSVVERCTTKPSIVTEETTANFAIFITLLFNNVINYTLHEITLVLPGFFIL